MSTPSWLSKNLFETALRQFLTSPVTVLEYNGRPVVGDSYFSNLIRTTITYRNGQKEQSKQISAFVKRKPQQPSATLTLINQLHFFENEIEFYKIILPEINKLLGNAEAIAPKFMYAELEPYPLLVIEDISPMGFKMLDRYEGLDLEHCYCVIRKLALLHATSFVLQERNPGSLNHYDNPMMGDAPLIVQWLELSLQPLIEACKRFPEFQKLAEKLERIKDQIPSRCAESFKPNLDEFCVLNHGDCWINNFMFSYDDNDKVEDVRFVDYQVVVYGSPAIDLHYFWATNPNIEVRQKHMHTILDYYHAQLLTNLEKLCFKSNKVPTLEGFKKDWISRAYYGFISTILALPIVKCDREDASLDIAIAPENGSDGFRHYILNSPRAWEHFRFLLPFFDDLGIFDY